MKYINSTNGTDQMAYGTQEDKTSGFWNTGWYIYMPYSLRKEISDLLEIKPFYCIGIQKLAKKYVIQTSRNLDPRNNKVEYIIVKDEYYQDIMNIISRPITEELRKEVKEEDDRNMGLVRAGLL